MTTTKTPPAPETLEERAARAARELAEVRAEQDRRAQEEHERLTEHQEQHDAELVAAYPRDKEALERAVEDARAALRQAITDDPLTQALTAVYTAEATRLQRVMDYLAARGRQGQEVSGVQLPYSYDVDVPEQMNLTARAIAGDWRAQAEADTAAQRATLPDTPQEEK